MSQLLRLSITDFKLIFRDPSLRIFLIMPLLVFASILLLLPYLVERYEGVTSFVPIVLMGAITQTSTMFGFINGMVLIHEKDIQVAKVYGIMPVSKVGFIVSRLLIPLAISTALTFLLIQLQPFYTFPIFPSLLLALLCGLLAPLLALTISIVSKNKMEGMTWYKLANLLISVPLAAYFIDKYTLLFGIIPSHWAFQILHNMVNGISVILPLLIGFGFILLALSFLINRFIKVHFR